MLPSSSPRKVNRACDACRRRKTKCDGPKMQDNICTNCRGSHKPCTYLEASTPRGPPKAYVTGLEDRLERLEELLKQVRPDTDFTAELGPPIPRGAWKDEGTPVASSSRLRSNDSSPKTSLRLSTHLGLNAHSRRDSVDSDSDSDGFSSSGLEQMAEGLKGGLRRLTLHRTRSKSVDHDAINTRFYGKSSVATLIDATRRFKELHISDTLGTEPQNSSVSSGPGSYAPFKRPEFWLAHPWELQWEGFEVDIDHILLSALENYPPPSLAVELTDLYFLHVNSQLPLLHRPTFERQYKDRLHHRNIWFSCVCLGVFSVASRWSNDPLVLPRNCNRTSSGAFDWTCAGWHYHNVAMGIHRIRQSLLYPASLEEIQTYSLLSAFLRGTANHPAAWQFTSLGLHKAQDVGAHRKKVYDNKPSVEGELWKRAFWCLIAYDRFGSAILGRPRTLGEEDFDLEPCLEVDDPYLETDPPFRQPVGVPCRLTFFNLWLKLSQIVTLTVSTIYAVHNPRALLGRIAKVRTNEVVAQLASALQDWLQSVPEYLRWSHQIENDDFSNQSATLHTTYHLAQMLLYRAFIPPVATNPASPAPQTHISSSIPALTYCITAARSSARIMETQVKRGWTNIPTLIAVSQLSAAILTLGVWDAKAKQQQAFEDIKPPPGQIIAMLMVDIGIFIGALEEVEGRWENVPNLIRALKDALPKGDSLLPKQHSPTSSHSTRPPPLLHRFDDTYTTDEHSSLPYHSSSIRTRHDSMPTYTDSRDSFHDLCRDNHPVKYDIGIRHAELRPELAYDKQGSRNPEALHPPSYMDDHNHAKGPSYTNL